MSLQMHITNTVGSKRMIYINGIDLFYHKQTISVGLEFKAQQVQYICRPPDGALVLLRLTEFAPPFHNASSSETFLIGRIRGTKFHLIFQLHPMIQSRRELNMQFVTINSFSKNREHSVLYILKFPARDALMSHRVSV